ncbi:unnamed protein product [Caenorhabditis sp. 36 PRJEB53466]|nr:unnamed protein product [Caenorhabditis sp. 36 PRJEB53466]
MSNCMVCDATTAQYHFGATVCRACAAFFRRYVNTKKATILCNCFAKRESQYSCRLCRMKKCVSVGMEQSKVQGPRDSNNPSRKRKIMIMEGSSAPELPRIEIGIRLRNVERICNAAKNYENLEKTRNAIFKMKAESTAGGVNFYELSLEVKTDAKLLWKLCEMTFPEFDQLNRHDKKILFYNFYTKWSILEMVMFCVKNKDQQKFFSPSGASAVSVERFYLDCLKQKDALSETDVLRIFQPYWNFHIQHVIQPVAKLGFGNLENMALFGLLLWDAGYTNLSESLAEVCHAMRKIICRELNAFFEETESSGSRFFETLDTINLIERAEHMCQEEMQLAGIYQVEIDEDMRNMIMWEKY